MKTMKVTKELAVQRFRQIVEHKKEMVERAKEYASVDIYEKYGIA